MQALAGSALVAGSSAAAVRVQRRSFAGSALRRAAANGSAARCRAFFKFGKKEEGPNNGGVPTDSEYFKGETRNDYQASDVEEYFMYMGMLASEGNYDRCEAMLASGTHPCDLLLLMACSENDDGKVTELLKAGADPTIKDINGRSGMDLATKEEVKSLLRAATGVTA